MVLSVEGSSAASKADKPAGADRCPATHRQYRNLDLAPKSIRSPVRDVVLVTAWLLDTNILSELRKPRPEPKVLKFIATRPLGDLFVSVVTFAEIGFGIQICAGRLPPGRTARLADAQAAAHVR